MSPNLVLRQASNNRAKDGRAAASNRQHDGSLSIYIGRNQLTVHLGEEPNNGERRETRRKKHTENKTDKHEVMNR